MLEDWLIEGAAAMGIDISAAQADAFARYHALLTAANAHMNLTRVPDDPREAVDRNYLDCIAPLAQGIPLDARPDGLRAVDVGSGAGFPGIPMAIMHPQIHFVLLDAQARRVQFLKGVIDALALNAEALHLRAETAARQPELRASFDLAVARAVAPMAVLAEYMLPLARTGGWMLAMKGPGLEAELACSRAAIQKLGGGEARVQKLAIPGRDWDHRAAWVPKLTDTPEAYPRRPGIPEKRPLSE